MDRDALCCRIRTWALGEGGSGNSIGDKWINRVGMSGNNVASAWVERREMTPSQKGGGRAVVCPQRRSLRDSGRRAYWPLTPSPAPCVQPPSAKGGHIVAGPGAETAADRLSGRGMLLCGRLRASSLPLLRLPSTPSVLPAPISSLKVWQTPSDVAPYRGSLKTTSYCWVATADWSVDNQATSRPM